MRRRGPPWLVTADTPCTAGRSVQVGPPPSVRQFGALGSLASANLARWDPWRSPIWRAGGVRPLAFANLARWDWLVTAGVTAGNS